MMIRSVLVATLTLVSVLSGSLKGEAQQTSETVRIVQGDALNRSRIATVVCVPLTSNLKWATAPGNVLLPSSVSGLPKESVANVSQLVTLDKTHLTKRMGKLAGPQLELVLSGIDVVLGR